MYIGRRADDSTGCGNRSSSSNPINIHFAVWLTLSKTTSSNGITIDFKPLHCMRTIRGSSQTGFEGRALPETLPGMIEDPIAVDIIFASQNTPSPVRNLSLNENLSQSTGRDSSAHSCSKTRESIDRVPPGVPEHSVQPATPRGPYQLNVLIRLFGAGTR
jgi:hypothetical protein